MAAYYDSFDYPEYWRGREYEHQSEILALKSLLSQVPQINRLIDIGAGYGRLTPIYLHRAKKIVLTDPSSKLLNIAKKPLKNKNIVYLQSKVENLNQKLTKKSFDLAIMVRVLHHLQDIDLCFETVNNLLDKNGYFILEFANKKHIKAIIYEFIKGNLTFPLEIFPKNLITKKIRPCLPFFNYHPGDIYKKLADNNFRIIKKISVSNIRSALIKKILPLDVLIYLEKYFQNHISSLDIGPSIFVLSQKKG